MSLDHAILGFLAYRPMTGYELKAMFDESVRHFWLADQSQIYRTLAKSAHRGWIVVEVVEQNTRPDRKVYRLTAAGESELHRWLSCDLPYSGERLPELVQVFFAGKLAPEEAILLIDGMIVRTREVLAQLKLKAQDTTHDPLWEDWGVRDVFFAHLTLESGLVMLQAKLSWLENVKARLANGDDGKGEHNAHAGN